jgi:hypothetical protein
MVADQNYFREKLRRHNRYLHGTGVVCGLWVTAAATQQIPWRVAISEGYALGPFGDEISVAETVYLDLARCAAGDQTDPCDPGAYHPAGKGAARELFVAIRYAECFAKPVRSMAAGCGCADAGCEYSRIRDSFELGCVPKPAIPSLPSICALLNRKAPAPCPPKPDDPWVVLGRVVAPASSDSAITDQGIDNSIRVQLFSTSMIQAQVIECCCGSKQPAPVQVTTVNPADGASLSVFPSQAVVTFDKDVQPATVSAKSILVAPAGGGSLAGSVTYDSATRTATFTVKANVAQGQFTVTVKGTGTSAVTDTDNLALDGLGNGKAGSDHVTRFTVREVIR